MNFFDKFQQGLETVVGPFATKVSDSKHIKALTEGFMYTMPISLGVAVIAVLSGLPIKPWVDFLNKTGLYSVGQEVVSLTLSLLAIYVVGAIGYCFTKNEGENAMAGSIIATASFILLMPMQTFTSETGASVSTLVTSYMGSDGIFLALLVGLFVPQFYCFLMKKNIRLTLPSSVPPMVSQSLSPTFAAMILFTVLFVIKYVCTLTPYGNLFTIVSTIIGKPVAYLGASPIALITVFTLMNLFWFFGIHPNAVLMCYMPVLMMIGLANQEAFLKGEMLPFLTVSVVGSAVQIGGAGNTLGLCIATLFAKSEKYKAMRKLVIPANIFNINEPIIFGFPLMLNPIYLLPMVLTPVVSGLVAWVLSNILTFSLNPTISMPWVTPGFISVFFSGGIPLLSVWLISLLIHFAMYLPFFLIDDKKALELEQNAR